MTCLLCELCSSAYLYRKLTSQHWIFTTELFLIVKVTDNRCRFHNLPDSVQLSDLLATKFGRHHNQLQLRRIIAEADTNQSGTIDYREFLGMMIGPNRSVLKT